MYVVNPSNQHGMMLIQQLEYAHASTEGTGHLVVTAIVYQLGVESTNYICTLSAQARLQIAVGDKAITPMYPFMLLYIREL